ncbi:meiosis-specific protein MEI4 isoform X2 [Centropristis striata]|uniref:meiosis-specific protein MEI4 isoform X2 n=1 Tax=Centropristis striata TaxID=184440 RepID=UPI0027DF2998|nr:meiosis-specific protein MEI4 isoform X2 [Centropristis striata]
MFGSCDVRGVMADGSESQNCPGHRFGCNTCPAGGANHISIVISCKQVNRRREMETKEEQLTGASPAEWFLRKARAALAVAIIKNKPSGVSGREYAEASACRLKSQDESWKDKAQGLERELLRLRQELLITRVTSHTKSTAEAASHDDPMDNASLDLFGPASEAYSSGSETPELLLEDPQPPIPFLEPPVPSIHHRSPVGMPPHVQFLQSMCALHRVEGNHKGLESLWFGPDGDAGSVLVDSVCQLLDLVVAACRDPPPMGPVDMVLQACQVTTRAIDLFCSKRLPSVEFKRRVEESLSELTGLLLHSHQLSGAREKSGLDSFPLDQYQNSCYLFWIVEDLLQRSQVPCRVEAGSEQSGFLLHLEQRILLLSDEFPLFFIYMWRIGGLITSK